MDTERVRPHRTAGSPCFTGCNGPPAALVAVLALPVAASRPRRAAVVAAAERLVAVAVRRQPRRGGRPRTAARSRRGAGAAQRPRRRAGRLRLAVREPGALAFGPERSARRISSTPLVAYGLDRVRRARHARGAGPDAISLRARFGRTRRASSAARTRSRPIGVAGGPPSLAGHERRARRMDRQRLARPPHRAGRDPVPGPVPAARHAARPRPGANVVAGAGARRDVRRLGARRRGRGARQARGPRMGPACSGSAARRGVRDTFRVVGSRPARVPRVAGRGRRVRCPARRRAAGRRHAASAQPQTIDTIDRDAPGGAARRRALVPIPERDALLAWTDWDGAALARAGSGDRPRARASAAPFDVSPAGEQSVLGDAASRPARHPGPRRHGDGRVEQARRGRRGRRPACGPRCGRRAGPSARPRTSATSTARACRPSPSTSVGTALDGSLVAAHRPRQPGVPLSQITTFARSSTRPG